MKEELEIKDKSRATEGIKVAPFRPHIRKTSPHKHNNYFEIIYLSKGEGSHTIDTREYEIKPPIIFTIRKEQVHFWDIITEPQGFVLIIKKSFIENCLDKDIKRLISDLSSQTCLLPKDNSAMDIYTLLQKEYLENKPTKKPIIDGLLKALLAKILESASTNFPKHISSTIYQKYIELLNQENILSNKVNHFARLLNTTPQNLNAICRKEAEQSANEILSTHIINEAKRLLIYTDLTVSEISSRLDFKDNSHFSKYFKRYVFKTPLGFRNEHS
jgi:AraC-like DNA-binding protein